MINFDYSKKLLSFLLINVLLLNFSVVGSADALYMDYSNFEIRDNSVIFFVKGYGHGVGMSQTGADSLAKQGSNYEEIIKHFYSNVDIINL